MYKVEVNNDIELVVQTDGDEIMVSGKQLVFDQSQIGADQYHILYKNKSYNIELVELDKVEKTASIKVNGNIYQVSVKDKFDELLKQLGLDSLTANSVQQVKAPMPGLVLNILVEIGATVKKGDNLLVLEAMKMENMIKSPADGLIKDILVKAGDKVEKNSVLIKF